MILPRSLKIYSDLHKGEYRESISAYLGNITGGMTDSSQFSVAVEERGYANRPRDDQQSWQNPEVEALLISSDLWKILIKNAPESKTATN